MSNKIVPSNLLEEKLSKFTQEQKDIIFGNLFSIQLTDGCRSGCYDCGLAAKKTIEDYIPPSFLKQIASEPKIKKGISLYYASDFFDYDFEGVGPLEVLEIFKDFRILTITNAPKGKEELIFKILFEDLQRGSLRQVINVLSVTDFNYKRLERAFENLDYVKKSSDA